MREENWLDGCQYGNEDAAAAAAASSAALLRSALSWNLDMVARVVLVEDKIMANRNHEGKEERCGIGPWVSKW